MLYKPGYGKFKDNCVVYHQNRFYLFAMYMKPGGRLEGERDYNNIWLAESDDGVHWQDIGPVVEDQKFVIYAMGVHTCGDKFILNHGSFGDNGQQNTIRFWESEDLRHWTYRAEDDLNTLKLDVSGKMRLDAMNVLQHQGKYYGYATGPRGFLSSEDGIKWDFIDTEIDFKGTPPSPGGPLLGAFEVGGCREINGIFYYLGGWFNYMGKKGYGVYTLRSQSPEGPFSPDPAAHRLTGNSERWAAMWARFVSGSSEPLVHGYMQQGFSYECGDTWMPPLKVAAVDQYGSLRLKYWSGNDKLMGAEKKFETIQITAKEYPSVAYDPSEIKLELVPESLDAENGVIITGFMEANCKDTFLVSPSAGIFMEESPDFGTFIWLHGYGLTEIGYGSYKDTYSFTCEDAIGPGSAAPAGLIPGKKQSFRLLIRKNMYEFYLDDYHIDLFNTTHFPKEDGRTPARIGFVVRNGSCIVSELKICAMRI